VTAGEKRLPDVPRARFLAIVSSPSTPSLVASRQAAGRPIDAFDAVIVGIARSRAASVATRNLADFEGCGVPVRYLPEVFWSDEEEVCIAFVPNLRTFGFPAQRPRRLS
jgi:hypothetical protein